MSEPGGHFEEIACPNCDSHQTARVLHTEPFWTYWHECGECGRTIMESEWLLWSDPAVEEFIKEHGK